LLAEQEGGLVVVTHHRMNVEEVKIPWLGSVCSESS